MKNETGDLVLVFNGEIYNFRELRVELEAAGHTFATRSDSEVLLHGYEEWGETLPRRLRGMFAFCIWDARREELFLARDPFGIKPLYYAFHQNTFLFASEIKGILAYPDFPKVLNEEALEQYLSFQYSVLKETFFKGVFRLEPGTWLRCQSGSVVLEFRRYFDPALQPAAGTPKGSRRAATGTARESSKAATGTVLDEATWTQRIERTLRESVQLHEQADVEVGTFLSGGVDSGLIAKLFHGKRAYTVGFGPEHCKYNEMTQARETADQCSLQHTGRRISQAEFWEAVPQVLYYLDEPSGDASAVALYFLSETASREVKAVLSGEGADELFGGYRIYCEPEALRRYQRLPAGLRRILMRAAKHLPDRKGKQFLIRGGQTVEERFIGNARIFTGEERRALLRTPSRTPSAAALLAEDYQRTLGMRDADRMQEIDLRYWLPGDILQKADRMSMAHSLEVRVPYLDRELFTLARQLPGHLKQQKHQTKILLRRVAARNLDLNTSQRPKLGFPVPIRVWLREAEGYARVRAAFESATAERYFHREALLKLLEDHKKERRDNSRKIWTVYAFCVWYDIYFAPNAKP